MTWWIEGTRPFPPQNSSLPTPEIFLTKYLPLKIKKTQHICSKYLKSWHFQLKIEKLYLWPRFKILQIIQKRTDRANLQHGLRHDVQRGPGGAGGGRHGRRAGRRHRSARTLREGRRACPYPGHRGVSHFAFHFFLSHKLVFFPGSRFTLFP